jgi:hypothetical protein
MHARSGQGNLPWSEFFKPAWKSVCTYRTIAFLRQVCDRSLIREGAVTCPATLFAVILPGLSSPLAGECPLYARAIVILVTLRTAQQLFAWFRPVN